MHGAPAPGDTNYEAQKTSRLVCKHGVGAGGGDATLASCPFEGHLSHLILTN